MPFNGSSCTVAHCSVSSALGSAYEVLMFDTIVFSNNEARGCAGLWPGNMWCALISPCQYTPGQEVVTWNSIQGNPLACTVPLYPAAFYLSPLPVQSKKVRIEHNSATDDLCVGMRFDQAQGWKCNLNNVHEFLSPYWFQLDNLCRGFKFDLVWGPPSPIDAIITANPQLPSSKCHYCNDGCGGKKCVVLLLLLPI